MKVLVFGMSEHHGGIESFMHSYVMNMDSNIQFDFVSLTETIPFEDDFTARGGKVFKVKGRKSGIKQYRDSLDSILADGNYDVVWSNLCTLSDIEILIRAKKHGVKKRIIHSHNSENMGNVLTKVLHAVNGTRLPNYATDLWACSQLAGEWMFGNKINSMPYELINNAIDSSIYKYDEAVRQTVRESLQIDKNDFVVGHVGRFHFQKNHEYLINIFRSIVDKHPNSKLALVGTGEDFDTIVHLVDKLGLKDKVLFLGQRNDVAKLLQGFDCFVLPSRFEGLPVVLVEAQASGLNTYVSTNVSEYSKISNLVEFLSLDDSYDTWADTILQKVDSVKKDTTDQIIASHYDIKEEALRVAKLLQS